MGQKLFVFAVLVLLVLPGWAFERTVEVFSTDDKPIAGAKIYYREFTGRIDPVFYGPTGFAETVLTTDAQGRVRIDKDIPARMSWAFATDYALILADGYTPALLPLQQLQNRICLKPVTYYPLTFTLPDGTPAAGATFVVTSVDNKVFQANNPFSGIATPQFIVTADDKGVAQFPDIGTGRMLNGVAYTAGYVNEAVSLQIHGMGPVTIPLKPAQQVKGVVTDAKGNRLAGAVIRCAEFLLPAVVSDRNGQFTFAHLPTTVPPLRVAGRDVDGTLTLYIDADNCARQGISLLPTGAKADQYAITMAPLITITGQILDRNTGQPVTNSRKYGYYIYVRHDLGRYAEGRTSGTFFISKLDGTFSIQIPAQACLEVRDSMAAGSFKPVIYHDGDAITLTSVSR